MKKNTNMLTYNLTRNPGKLEYFCNNCEALWLNYIEYSFTWAPIVKYMWKELAWCIWCIKLKNQHLMCAVYIERMPHIGHSLCNASASHFLRHACISQCSQAPQIRHSLYNTSASRFQRHVLTSLWDLTLPSQLRSPSITFRENNRLPACSQRWQISGIVDRRIED